MSPVYDKQRFREWFAHHGDTKRLDHSINTYCRQLVKESAIVPGSTVTVTRGIDDGREFAVTDIDHAEAEVRGRGSGGWWPVEAVSLVRPTTRKTRTLAREGNT